MKRCKVNINAPILSDKYKELLYTYAIPEDLLPQITSRQIDVHKEHQSLIQEEISRIQPIVEDLKA